MKILHTADWHIGQLFYGYDRNYEHQQFLNWLVDVINNQEIDLLLVSGDIFDLSNPGAASIKMFYTFLNQAVKIRPGLQIIIIAGNHDSATRMESPKPLLESSNIHIIGMAERDSAGAIDYDKMLIPIKDAEGKTILWCIAVPFLRLGDYPSVPGSISSYMDGVSLLYKEIYELVTSRQEPTQAVLAMGHLHAMDAELSDHDTTERVIMGGVECIPSSAFHMDICYTALGHIHKAQRIGGRENVRYSGSPIPMSFSEVNYRHQVVTMELKEAKIINIEPLEIPLIIPLLRIPSKPKVLSEVLAELQQLAESTDSSVLAPYLEVRVLLEGPEPSLRHQIETAIEGKYVRLAKIDVSYPTGTPNEQETITYDKLSELKPVDLFHKIYESKYHNETPEALIQLFNEVTQEVQSKENNS